MDRRQSPLCLAPTHSEAANLKGEESAQYRFPISDDLWQNLLVTLRDELSRLDTHQIQLLIRRIAEGIRSMDGVMTRYCELTCPFCEDPCCTGLKVFYNQADMLYLVTLGEELPPGQTRAQAAEPCRYLAPDGCLLPRIIRPYVCVWFICEAQMELFQAESAASQRRFIETMQDVRACRLKIESLYEYYFPGQKKRHEGTPP